MKKVILKIVEIVVKILKNDKIRSWIFSIGLKIAAKYLKKKGK